MPIQPLLLRLEIVKETEDIWRLFFFKCKKIVSKFFFYVNVHFSTFLYFLFIFVFLFLVHSSIPPINYWSTIFLSIVIEDQCERKTTYSWVVHSLLKFCIVIKHSSDFLRVFILNTSWCYLMITSSLESINLYIGVLSIWTYQF